MDNKELWELEGDIYVHEESFVMTAGSSVESFTGYFVPAGKRALITSVCLTHTAILSAGASTAIESYIDIDQAPVDPHAILLLKTSPSVGAGCGTVYGNPNFIVPAGTIIAGGIIKSATVGEVRVGFSVVMKLIK